MLLQKTEDHIFCQKAKPYAKSLDHVLNKERNACIQDLKLTLSNLYCIQKLESLVSLKAACKQLRLESEKHIPIINNLPKKGKISPKKNFSNHSKTLPLPTKKEKTYSPKTL